MVDDCTVLLAHCADKGPYKGTVAGLADECGINPSTLHEILEDAHERKTASLLYAVARPGQMNGGPCYDFVVYRGFNGRYNGDRLPRSIIDVVTVHC